MSIVQEIINLHGGRIEIQSSLGVGTTVTLWIPSADAVSMKAHFMKVAS